MKLAVAVIIFFIFFVTNKIWAETAAPKAKILELKKRLNNLEKQQKEMEDWRINFYQLGKGHLSPFLNDKISLGGYFETGIINIYGPDTENQTSANLHALGLNITADFSEKIRFVTQTSIVVNIPLMNINNNPNLTPSKRTFTYMTFGSYLLQGYLEYSESEYFNIQSGIGYAPFGIAFQQREAFLFHVRGGPQVITNDDGFNISVASALWMGIHIYGLLPNLDTNNVGYNLYTMTPGSNVATLGFGGRLWWAINQNVTAGTSFQHGERRQGSYLAKGFDIDIKYNQFGLISEYAAVVNSGQAVDSEAYYFEPYYKFLEDQWLVYINVEYLRSIERFDVFTQIPDPFEKLVSGVGLNWLPIPTTRYRIGYANNNYLNETDSMNGQKKDYDSIELSAALAF